MNRILIIENQFVHFKKLQDGLKSDSVYVIPSGRDEFVRFISAVKVFLNPPGYSESYRESCWKEIKSEILGTNEQGRVNLIIMDIVLGGATICKTGLDLALEIWNKIDREIPILFLSRSDYSDEHRYLMEQQFKKKQFRCDWLMKGFMGYETLAESFIKYTVSEKIQEMLKKHWPAFPSDNPNQLYLDKIDLFVKSPISVATREGFEKIRKPLADMEIILSDDDPFAREILFRIEERPTYDDVLEKMLNERLAKTE